MPKVSIVIPVYNVEQYLEACLDSVLTQTLRDIDIICVDDGSPDRCPQILDEYAAKDSRITVIHKENGGLSSARNAAYPHIRGEYTLFVDSDDFIEPSLCEKTVVVADREQADMTLFLYRFTSPLRDWTPLEDFLAERPFSEIDTVTLLRHMTAWSKLWRSRFLLDNQITFPEGLCYEDNVAHWKALALDPVLALVPEKLYWYRVNPDSIMFNSSKVGDIVDCYEIIRKHLIDAGKYEGEWKELFLTRKLSVVYGNYASLPPSPVRTKMLKAVRATLGGDERKFLEQNIDFGRIRRQFYLSLLGSKTASVKYYMYKFIDDARNVVADAFPTRENKLRRTGRVYP